jgi:hypothetical protein
VAAGLLGAVFCAATAATAQRYAVPLASERDYDAQFHFCRVWYRGNPAGDGGSWGVDYPQADINVSVRLSELTKTPVSMDSRGEPRHLIVRLTDDALFQCPFVMMTEAAAAYIDPAEARQLRLYVEKGGFFWADDFWGSYAWQAWVQQLRKALPADEFPIIDLPPDHPIFRTHLVINGLPQISSINHWLATGHSSERGADSAQAHARAIVDRHGRVMVLMTHNTDIGDSWEREGEDPEYFYQFSVKGYAVGLNVMLYAMTH